MGDHDQVLTHIGPRCDQILSKNYTTKWIYIPKYYWVIQFGRSGQKKATEAAEAAWDAQTAEATQTVG